MKEAKIKSVLEFEKFRGKDDDFQTLTVIGFPAGGIQNASDPGQQGRFKFVKAFETDEIYSSTLSTAQNFIVLNAEQLVSMSALRGAPGWAQKDYEKSVGAGPDIQEYISFLNNQRLAPEDKVRVLLYRYALWRLDENRIMVQSKSKLIPGNEEVQFQPVEQVNVFRYDANTIVGLDEANLRNGLRQVQEEYIELDQRNSQVCERFNSSISWQAKVHWKASELYPVILMILSFIVSVLVIVSFVFPAAKVKSATFDLALDITRKLIGAICSFILPSLVKINESYNETQIRALDEKEKKRRLIAEGTNRLRVLPEPRNAQHNPGENLRAENLNIEYPLDYEDPSLFSNSFLTALRNVNYSILIMIAIAVNLILGPVSFPSASQDLSTALPRADSPTCPPCPICPTCPPCPICPTCPTDSMSLATMINFMRSLCPTHEIFAANSSISTAYFTSLATDPHGGMPQG